jgi:hypothetical protein
MDEVAADTVAIIAKRVPVDERNLSMTTDWRIWASIHSARSK